MRWRNPFGRKSEEATQLGALNADRGISPIGGHGPGPARIVLVAGVGLGLGALVLSDSREPPAPGRPLDPPRVLQPFEPAPTPEAQTPPDVEPTIITPGNVITEASAAPSDPRTPPPVAPMMAVFRQGAASGQAVRSANPSGVEGRASGEIARRQAYRLGDLRRMITAGRVIGCRLETAVDSSQPGPASCRLHEDVRADAGAAVLLPRGSRLIGQTSRMAADDRRLAILWQRALTPDGQAIDLASPAADPLGRIGIDGELDLRNIERLGPPLAFSLVESLAEAPLVDTGSRGAGEVAANAFARGETFRPILRRPAGTTISLFLVEDLDFAPGLRRQP